MSRDRLRWRALAAFGGSFTGVFGWGLARRGIDGEVDGFMLVYALGMAISLAIGITGVVLGLRERRR